MASLYCDLTVSVSADSPVTHHCALSMLIVLLTTSEPDGVYQLWCVFQAIDLRWGIRDESQDDHTTIDFCLREIENCQKATIGPSFVVSLTPGVSGWTDTLFATCFLSALTSNRTVIRNVVHLAVKQQQ